MTTIVGLTGGIASGKSTVGRMLEKLGAVLIDADAIVHELQAPGAPLLDEIAAEFGEELIDATGALDRAALSAIVFRDPEARRRLGALVHPPVGAEMTRRIGEARAAGAPLIVLDIPLLFEGRKTGTGNAARFPIQSSILVWVPEAVQLARQMARDGCSPEDALRRIRSQLPLDEKRQMADYVIDNSGSLEATERQVRALWERLVDPPERGR